VTTTPGAAGALLPAGATVLAATDGSALAGNAARVAAALADRAAVAARAIHVVDTRAVPLPPAVHLAIALGDEIVGAGVHAGQEVEVRAGIVRAVGREVDWPVHLAIGRPAAEIEREAVRVGASLVIVGLQPHARLARVGSDETVVALMRAGTRPVLGVAASLVGMPRRAHAAVDFTAASLGAARGALALLAPGGTLTLAYVPPLPLYDAAHGEHLVHSLGVDAAFAWFEGALGAPADVRVERAVLRGRQPCPPAELLLAHAAASGADLLALGNRRHGRVERLLLGSTTTDVVRDGRVSVLAVPPGTADDGGLPSPRTPSTEY
jgi:nucleotide-binding universal stress UspA family protein